MEKAMAPHSSTLAWKIPWTEEPGGLQSMGSWRVGHDFTFTFHFHALEKEMATHSLVLAWRIPGTGEPGGPPSMGLHRFGHNWSDLAAAAAAVYEVLIYHIWYSKEQLSPFPGGSAGKESACSAGDPGLIAGWRRSPGEGNGNPLQSSCRENPVDREAWRATAHGVAKESDMTWQINHHKDQLVVAEHTNPLPLSFWHFEAQPQNSRKKMCNYFTKYYVQGECKVDT